MFALTIGLVLIGLTAMLLIALAACLRMHQSIEDVRKRLGAYLPAQVLRAVLGRSHDRPMAKYYPAATIIVLRINNFASLIERLSPHAALRYINECHLLCGTAIHRNGGIIERFLEDGLVAVFGIDEQGSSDHEYQGLRAGLEAARLVASMKDRWESEGRRPFRVASGVHSGPIIAGDVGFGDQRSFALVGSAVVVAQQLQRLSEELNTSVLTSGDTFKHVRDRFVAMPIKQIPIRHSAETHDAYIVRSLAASELVEELGLPPFTLLTTQVTDDMDFFRANSRKKKTDAVWQRLYARPVISRSVDTGHDDAPIMPDLDWTPPSMPNQAERFARDAD